MNPANETPATALLREVTRLDKDNERLRRELIDTRTAHLNQVIALKRELAASAALIARDTATIANLTAERDALRDACRAVLHGLDLSPVPGMETDADMLRAALAEGTL